MRGRKHVYVCDHCGKIGLEQTYFFMTDTWKCAPEGWGKLGKEDLCPTCYETYKRFNREVAEDFNGGMKMRNVVIFSSEDISDLFRDTPVVIHDKNGIETVFVSERGHKAMLDKEN